MHLLEVFNANSSTGNKDTDGIESHLSVWHFMCAAPFRGDSADSSQFSRGYGLKRMPSAGGGSSLDLHENQSALVCGDYVYFARFASSITLQNLVPESI